MTRYRPPLKDIPIKFVKAPIQITLTGAQWTLLLARYLNQKMTEKELKVADDVAIHILMTCRYYTKLESNFTEALDNCVEHINRRRKHVPGSGAVPKRQETRS